MLRINNISLDVASEIGAPSIIAYLPTHFWRVTTSILVVDGRIEQPRGSSQLKLVVDGRNNEQYLSAALTPSINRCCCLVRCWKQMPHKCTRLSTSPNLKSEGAYADRFGLIYWANAVLSLGLFVFNNQIWHLAHHAPSLQQVHISYEPTAEPPTAAIPTDCRASTMYLSFIHINNSPNKCYSKWNLDDPICSESTSLLPCIIEEVSRHQTSLPAWLLIVEVTGDTETMLAVRRRKGQAFGEKIIALIESYFILYLFLFFALH